MSSVILNQDNIVVSVMSYDPVSENHLYIKTYQPELVGMKYQDGEFIELPEPQEPEAQ